MRTIKFRGKSVKDGSWLIGDLIHNKECIYIALPEVVMPLVIGSDFVVCPETVGQSTGIFDKNNKEVYEGDIVAWEDSDGNQRKDVVKWLNGGLCLCNSSYTVGTYGDLRIDGNIYDVKPIKGA